MRTKKLKISPEALELQLPFKSQKQLETLYYAIIDYKMNDVWGIEDEAEICKIERVETIIAKELQRRGWVDMYDSQKRGELARHLMNLRKKKRYF